MKSKPARYIILDTNIFQHFSNTDLSSQIFELLNDARNKGYGLALSQYSILELVNGASIKKEKQRLSAIQGMKNFKVKKDILIAAGHLGSLYREDGKEEKQQPEIGDKIIGATAIIFNAVIYTTNAQDFLPPYFKEIGRHYLTYKRNNREVCILGYFMEPDLEAVASRYNQYINSDDGQHLVSANEDTEK